MVQKGRGPFVEISFLKTSPLSFRQAMSHPQSGEQGSPARFRPAKFPLPPAESLEQTLALAEQTTGWLQLPSSSRSPPLVEILRPRVPAHASRGPPPTQHKVCGGAAVEHMYVSPLIGYPTLYRLPRPE